MAVFQNYAQARESLTKNKWAYTHWNKTEQRAVTATLGDMDGYLDDFARIATFLCNAGEFQAALADVSAMVWAEYVELDPQLRNRFTRALGKVATAYGFDFQNRMPLDTSGTAPIGVRLVEGDPQLGYMLRNKLFWKDSMDSRHGEHTHSLQWLAIALGANTTRRTAELYAKTADFRAPSKNDVKGGRSMIMWQWIADCFPQDMKKFATEKYLNDETLESHSARAPQFIMDSLLLGNPQQKSATFLAVYLFGRYKNRGWLDYNKGTKEVTDIQTQAISTHGASERAQHGWTPSPSSPKARLNRDATAYALQGPHTTKAKMKATFTFHGLEGVLSYHHVE